MIGTVFFHLLLIFPLRQYGTYQDHWSAVERYSTSVGVTHASVRPAFGRTCPECGGVNRADSSLCTACGTKLQGPTAEASAPADVVCPECQRRVTGGTFCSNCGTALQSPSAHP